MRPWSHVPRSLFLVLLAALALAGGPAGGQTPKRGGILNAMLAEDPPGFLVHESSTISGVWPLSPCYSNLVLFDPLKQQESAETVVWLPRASRPARRSRSILSRAISRSTSISRRSSPTS